MGIVRALPDLEGWLDADADSWASLADQEYKTLVRHWSERFSPLIAAGASCLQGSRAMLSLENRLPADVYVLSGMRVPQLANMGGRGPAAYQAIGLRSIPRVSANRMELIVVSVDFTWSCVFSHEAGAFVWEQLYECGANAQPHTASDCD
jgi:hypothetical protein